MSTVSPQRLAEVFVEIADTLVDEFDLIRFLQLVTARTAELLPAGAVGLLLADPEGELQFMAASDELTRLLELFELQHCDGPGLEAFRSGTAVFTADLASATDRWPAFAPRAVEAGFASVHALPMRLRGEVLGALNLLGTGARVLEPADVRIAQALLDVATIGLLQERTIRRGELLAEQLQGALNSRVVIEQAKGALAQIHGVSVDEAFNLLRGYSRRQGRRLSEVAQAVLSEDRSSIADLAGS
jgi:GAF domain-containing protein